MRTITKLIPLACLSIAFAQAQEKKEYTNFADTTFNLQEVVTTAHYKARPQITKLDVPMTYLPISVSMPLNFQVAISYKL